LKKFRRSGGDQDFWRKEFAALRRLGESAQTVGVISGRLLKQELSAAARNRFYHRLNLNFQAFVTAYCCPCAVKKTVGFGNLL
jgi:hypothetical protein